MAKRPIIDELVEGVAAMKSQREGKLTLRHLQGWAGAASQGGLQTD